jgi:hypothetical protein
MAPPILFPRDKPLIASSIKDGANLLPDVADLVADFLVSQQDPFGAAEWKKYAKVDPGPEIPFSRDFAPFWNGPDPVDLADGVPNPRLVSETHLPPVFAPRFFSYDTTLFPRTLQNMNRVGVSLDAGYFGYDAWLRRQEKKVGPSYWLVMRKEIVCRGKSWEETEKYLNDLKKNPHTRYEELPSALDLCTVLAASFLRDRKCYLGDTYGEEKQHTFSRCKEHSIPNDPEYQMVLGGFQSWYGEERGEAKISHAKSRLNSDIGLALLRKF